MNIRPITESDSGTFLLLCKTLDQETQFMMLEPGERTTTVEEQSQRIKHVLSTHNQMILVAEDENRLVGFLGAYGGGCQRNHHCAYIVTGILQQYVGQGIGAQFFNVLDEWATAHNIHRLELTVMCNNERAVHLYKKMGFAIEGRKKDSLLVNGNYVDEYYMAKML
jgi:RimJ/RimL family protein N-acetyltransferase